MIGRNGARLDAAVRRLDSERGHEAIVCDVGDSDAVTAVFRKFVDSGRPPHILVNNAGRAQSASFASLTDDAWEQTLRVNLTGTFLCTRAALPAMLALPTGRVVNIASTAGLIGYPHVAAYCAAKHGVIGLTRALALEFEALLKRNPQRRLIMPEDVAAAVAWLCLPESQSINGQAISLSGGEVMTG